MIQVHVEVSGPGGCIFGIAEAIEKALKDAGAETYTTTSYEKPTGFQPAKPADDLSGFYISIHQEHMPWGG